mmetsp:Transcript_4123/g.16542  ORF Transcript_4123/g.16542 Transcript_4123/m.16542 type:complete len:205 (-) Transcript_4123:588-1202(-)
MPSAPRCNACARSCCNRSRSLPRCCGSSPPPGSSPSPARHCHSRCCPTALRRTTRRSTAGSTAPAPPGERLERATSGKKATAHAAECTVRLALACARPRAASASAAAVPPRASTATSPDAPARALQVSPRSAAAPQIRAHSSAAPSTAAARAPTNVPLSAPDAGCSPASAHTEGTRTRCTGGSKRTSTTEGGSMSPSAPTCHRA